MSQAWTARRQNSALVTEMEGFSEGKTWTYLELFETRTKEC